MVNFYWRNKLDTDEKKMFTDSKGLDTNDFSATQSSPFHRKRQNFQVRTDIPVEYNYNTIWIIQH